MPAKKRTAKKSSRPRKSAAKLGARKRQLAEREWWGDDFTGWFEEFVIDPIMMTPPGTQPHLRTARTEMLRAFRSLIDYWIERSERSPRRRAASARGRARPRATPRSVRVRPS